MQMDCSISLLFESVKARLNEPCDEYGLWKVSRMVVTSPDQLGACLRLPHEVTVEVNKDHHDYRDKLYNLLLQWRRRKSNHHGTWADLVKTLSELSERVLLEGVRDLLKEEDGRSVSENGWKCKDLSSSLDSGIGRSSTSGSEGAYRRRGVAMSSGEYSDTPPTSYSSFATCSSLSSVEADSSPFVFPDDPTAPSDPYPSLRPGTQSSSSAFNPEWSGVGDGLVPVCDVGVSGGVECDPLGVGMATDRGDVDGSPPTVFHTPLSTLDEGHVSRGGCRTHQAVGSNGGYRKQFSAVGGSGAPPLHSGLPASSHRSLSNSPEFIRHNCKSESHLQVLHMDAKNTELLTKLDESARQMSCRVNQLKWRNKSLKMKKQGLEDKRVALIHENSRLEREIEELKATSSCRFHHPAPIGVTDAQFWHLRDELALLHQQYHTASCMYARLTLDCANLEAQRDSEVRNNVRLLLQRNELKRCAPLEMVEQGQHRPNMYQRQRSFSDSSIDVPHFDSFGPSSFEGYNSSIDAPSL